jgi:hypothetical protein
MTNPPLNPFSPFAQIEGEPSDSTDLAQQLLGALADARKGGKGGITYTQPTTEQYREYRNFIATSLARGSFSSTPVLAGFRTVTLDGKVELLTEEPNAKHGSGVVVFRRGQSLPLVVEVPHSFFDEGTLDIGLRLFLASKAQLLLVNTAHRYRNNNDLPPAPKHARRDNTFDDSKTYANDESPLSSDVAHADVSFFLAAHEAFMDFSPKALTVQIHGFADKTIPNIDIVASAARTKSRLSSLVSRLRDTLALRVALYPEDTKKLGGTTNVEAKYNRVKGTCFVHLELSETLRIRLKNDSALMAQFATIIFTEARCD